MKANQVKGWFLWREETVVPGGNFLVQSREPTNSTHMTPSLGIERGPHWREASALTTMLYLLPSSFTNSLNHLRS